MSDKVRVLAVDDAVANLAIIRGCLRGGNFELTTTTNALDGLRLFKDNYYDVVILDVLMPGITGFELRKLIREIDKERPIIFLTAMVDDANMTMLNQISWDANTYYLSKLADKKLLTQKIMEVHETYRVRKIDRLYSRKLESELKLAGDLQKVMLPRWCQLDDSVLVSSVYAPTLQVSGDVFEVLPLDDGRHLLFIGDIAGHGIAAAMYMTTVLAYLKVEVRRWNFTPAELLANLNTFFCQELGGNTYMTAVVAILDYEHGTLVQQSAGHASLMLGSTRDGSVVKLPENRGGFPLGWFPHADYPAAEEVRAELYDDTVVLAYTDGIFDLSNEHGESPDIALISELFGALAQDADALLLPSRLMSSLEQIGYVNRTDDVTMLAVQKRRSAPYFMEKLLSPSLPNVSATAEEFSSLSRDVQTITLIELCLHEYLNNVITHGSRRATHQQPIYVSIEQLSDGRVQIRGADCGEAWNLSVPPPDNNDSDMTDEKEKLLATSGRGIQILREITESISSNVYFGVNETVFVLKRDGRP